jgi:RNA polymerase sigma-70 factor (ECF subfamily)
MTDSADDSAETRGLLELARAGDRAACERLFARHRSYLRRVIELRLDPRLRPRVDPSDVVQEAQLEAYRRLSAYVDRHPMTFRLWLRKTVQERLLMLRRFHLGAARRDAARELPWPDDSSVQVAWQLKAGGASPSQVLAGQERARQVHEAVGQLPAADREVLILRNLEGLSNAEVAQLLRLDTVHGPRWDGWEPVPLV